MKLQKIKRLIKEDFDNQYQGLIEKIGYCFNSFGEDVVNLVNNKNISIEDNLNQTKKSITVKVDSSGVPVTTLQFKSGLTTNTYGILVVKCVNTASSTSYPTAAPFINFSENNGLITINRITGLVANQQYTLNLIIIG